MAKVCNRNSCEMVWLLLTLKKEPFYGQELAAIFINSIVGSVLINYHRTYWRYIITLMEHFICKRFAFPFYLIC